MIDRYSVNLNYREVDDSDEENGKGKCDSKREGAPEGECMDG